MLKDACCQYSQWQNGKKPNALAAGAVGARIASKPGNHPAQLVRSAKTACGVLARPLLQQAWLRVEEQAGQPRVIHSCGYWEKWEEGDRTYVV